MATLQKIRNRAGLLVAIIGIALVCFVLGDLINSGTSLFNSIKDNAFSVDGDVVTTGEYSNRINQFEEFQKMISGQNSLDENTSGQIREFIYQQMVNEKMLDDQAERLGLAVSSEEMTDLVYGQNISPVLSQSPVFTDPQTGQFNRGLLQNFLTFVLSTDQSQLSEEQKFEHQRLYSLWLMLEKSIKYQRLTEKYNVLVLAGIGANNVEVQSQVSDAGYNATIAYVINRYSLMPDSAVSVSEKEIEKLYNERKNNFRMNGEEAEITYFAKDILPSEEDYAEVEKEINQVVEDLKTTTNPALIVTDYSEEPYLDVFINENTLTGDEKLFVSSANVGDTYGPIRGDQVYNAYKLIERMVVPDSVKLSMISIPLTDESLANEVADSLMTVIKGGKDFSTVATEANSQNGGEVGWVTEISIASIGADFIRPIFSANKGEVLKLRTRNVTQLVKIDDKTNPVPKVKIAIVRMPVPASDKTIMNIDNELDRFVSENGNISNFETAAREKGYNVMDRTVLPSNINLDQIRGSRPVISWAFNEDIGTVKKFDLTEQRVVAAIKKKYNGEYAPLSLVSEFLKNELIKEKKAEKIIANLKEKNLTTLPAYADALGTAIDTLRFVNFATSNISMLGREPQMNVYSKYAEVNKLQEPVKGTSGVLVLSVTNREDAPATQDTESVKSLLNNAYGYRLGNFTNVLQSLKQKMDVKDNRVTFF